MPQIKTNFVVVLAIAGFLLAEYAGAQSNIEWQSTSAGSYDWFNTANWVGGNVPDSSGERARFNTTNSTQMSGTINISIDSNVTVAGLVFNGVTGTVATNFLSGSGAITLNNTSGTRALLQRNSNSPNPTISNNIVLGDADGVDFTPNQSFRLDGAISGANKMIVSGSGSVLLGGANSFSGAVDISGTMAALVNNTFSGASAGTYTFTGSARGTVGTYVTSSTTTFANPIVLSNAGTGQIRFSSGGTGSLLDITTSSITDQGTNSNGALEINKLLSETTLGVTVASGTGTVKFSGTGFTINRNVTGGSSTSILELAPSSGTQTWNRNFTGFQNSSTVVKSGNGTVILAGTNSYTAATTLSGGTLVFASTNARTASTVTAAAGTTVGLGVGGADGYSSAQVDALFANTLTGFSINATTRVGLDTTGGNFTYATAQSAARGLTKLGANTLTLSGANTYSGGTLVSGGTLRGDSTSLQGAITNNAATIFDNATNGTYAGVMSGTGTVAKTGAATLTLNATNTYSGATTVEAGKLAVNGAISNSAVTVQSGAALGGNGTVGSTTIANGGILAPGNSAGTLSINGGMTWQDGGGYDWEIFNLAGPAGTGWDLAAATGALDLSGLNGPYNINIFSLAADNSTPGALTGFNPLSDYEWKIASFASVSGTFNTNKFAINSAGFTSYNPNSGIFALELSNDSKDLYLTYTGGGEPIPEPGTWAAAALLAGCAGFLRWRKRRRT